MDRRWPELGNPDMRTPIAHALAWPDRIPSGVAPLNLFTVARLDFEPPDVTRFPCLRLAREALAAGGTATAVLNASNEVAVAAFLDRRLSFLGHSRSGRRYLGAGAEPRGVLPGGGAGGRCRGAHRGHFGGQGASAVIGRL